MPEKIELKIKNNRRIYQELTRALASHREKPNGSVLFIVEGTKKKPIIGILYPGRKLRKRDLKVQRSNSALWANLFDFEVIPFKDGKEIKTQRFTFDELGRDFQNYKRVNKKFWSMLEELYSGNIITKKAPILAGIDSELYLHVLKWIWIQEDFNYKYNWRDVESPIKYILETRTGTRTSKGAGRAKFFAALVLIKYYPHYFNFEQVKKIIPSY